jgi:hypothetical protein
MWHLNTVISAIKLFLLISLGLTFLLGQGWLAVGPILHGSLTIKKRNIPLIQEFPLMLMCGLIINYGMILIFQSLTISLIAGGILSIFGICCFTLYVFRYHSRQILTPSSINKWIGISFICLLFLSPILSEPLIDWDGRSIWFFHAKMIYVADTIGQSAGWQQPSVVFSAPDYPNLVPALGAQVAHVMGFWNEYIPKASLFFMLVPAVAWLFTFARRSFSFVILLLLILFSSFVDATLYNGLMDAYFALYFSIAMLLLGRYINSSQPIDMVSSLCCLIALLYIKNEGALAALIGLCLIILMRLLKENPIRPKTFLLMKWKYYLAGIIALIPFALWSLYKQQWGLSNALGIGTTQSFLRIISRLTDGSYGLVFQDVYVQIKGALLLLGLLYFASVALNKSFVKESLPALTAAGIYCLGMIIIYLLTPYDLGYQLSSSITRTMLSVNGCIFIGSYYILNAIENNESVL